MFQLDNYPAHTYYIMELLGQSKGRLGWHTLFDNALTLARRGEWESARSVLSQAMEIAQRMPNASPEELEKQRGVAQLLKGAFYLAERERVETFAQYRYAEETFTALAEDYGLAVTAFLFGLYYHALRQWQDAYTFYELSLQHLRKPIPSDSALQCLRVDLRMRYDEVKQAMLDQHQKRAAPPLPPSPPPQPPPQPREPDPSPADPSEPDPSPTPEKDSGRLALFPIYQDVSAGSGIWIKSYRDFNRFLEIDRVWIDDQRYSIRPLTSTGSRVLQFQRNYWYGIASVRGDSMDRLDILDGDFVIIEKPELITFAPKDQDIVIAAINPGDHGEVVIKRVRLADPQILLVSENKDDKYEPKSYQSGQVDMIGRVVAILKRAR